MILVGVAVLSELSNRTNIAIACKRFPSADRLPLQKDKLLTRKNCDHTHLRRGNAVKETLPQVWYVSW